MYIDNNIWNKKALSRYSDGVGVLPDSWLSKSPSRISKHLTPPRDLLMNLKWPVRLPMPIQRIQDECSSVPFWILLRLAVPLVGCICAWRLNPCVNRYGCCSRGSMRMSSPYALWSCSAWWFWRGWGSYMRSAVSFIPVRIPPWYPMSHSFWRFC